MFQIILKKPISTTRVYLLKAWNNMIPKLALWAGQKLVPALVHGGMGLQGIEQTKFFEWANSDEGLSELGIPRGEPMRLLEAYKTKSFRISYNHGSLSIGFGDRIAIKLQTPHPFYGVKKLKVKSWMTWVFDGQEVSDAGFVSRDEIELNQPKLTRYIRLAAPLGGLMLAKNALRLSSSGKWRVPAQFVSFDSDWAIANMNIIESLLINKAFEFFQKELN